MCECVWVSRRESASCVSFPFSMIFYVALLVGGETSFSFFSNSSRSWFAFSNSFETRFVAELNGSIFTTERCA